MSVIVDGTNGLIFNDASTQTTAASGFGFKNRIINGDMRIDQRNAGASVSTSSTPNVYTLDRWLAYYSAANKFTIQQDSSVYPVGFTHSLKITSSAATTPGSGDEYSINQNIEGYNVADLNFGLSTAKTITLSFWVRCSLTGTFGGAIRNFNGTRSYPFSYTITAANTWEQKSVTITGDTSGTWQKTTSAGFLVGWSLGNGSTNQGTAGAWVGSNKMTCTGETQIVGTSGATFYITGVQLEKGSTATDFDFREYGNELRSCQRYYYNTMFIRGANSLTAPTDAQVELQGARHQFGDVTGYRGQQYSHPVLMRAAPTIVVYNPLNSGTTGQWYFYNHGGQTQNYSGGPAGYRDGIVFNAYTGVTVGTSGMACQVWAHWSASSEL